MVKFIEDEMQYWYHHRIFDSFIILFERKDGTVLVSENLQRVYLVVDVDFRLALKCTYFWSKDMKTVREQAKQMKPCSPFGSIYGKKVTVMLFPLKDMIITDGAIFHSERLTAAHIQEAVKAYIRAVDTNTLITKIDKIKPTLNHEEVEIDEDVLTRQKIENYDGIRILKSAPTRSTRSMWWFLEER